MKKLIKWILLTILLLVIVLAVALVIFIKTFDLNKYKSEIEQIVYQQTGRQLSLNGDAGLKISLVPTLVLNEIALGNAEWAKEPNMVKAQTAEVSLSLLPLLDKQLVVNKVFLKDPEVYLDVNKDGVANWNFAKEKSSDTSSVESNITDENNKVTTVAKDAVVVGVVAKHLNIENGIIVYNDMKHNSKTEIKITSLTLNTSDEKDDITLDFDVNYNNEKISGNIVAGSIDTILQNKDLYPIKAKIKAYGLDLQTEATIRDILNQPQYNGTIHVINPSGNFGAPAIDLTTDISGTMDEIKAILKPLKVASNTITGTVSADLKSKTPYIVADLASDKIDLMQLMSKPVKTARRFSLISEATAATFVPDSGLDLKVLNTVNAQVKIAIKELLVNDMLQLQNVNASAVLNNGLLTVQPLSLVMGGGTVTGSATLNAKDNAATIKLTGDDVVLQSFWPGLKITDTISFGIINGGKTTISINLKTQGNTIRQMVENLDGQVIAIVGESEIQTGELKYLKGDFISQILQGLKIKNADKKMKMHCAVVRSDITNGKAEFPKGIVFNAKQMTVVSNGSINLRNDKLDLTIHPFNGKIADTNVAQVISSLIKITGTIEKPRIGIDNASVIKNVVGVAAAGPAFVGSQLLLDADESPCYTALEGTSYQNMFPAPTGIKASGQGIYQGTSEVIDSGVELITDTAKGMLKLLKGK